MPIFNQKVQPFKPTKEIDFSWNSFRKGLNILLQDTEIDKEELAQATNLMLIGRGIPTKRWGSSLYFQAGNATGQVRGLKGFYPSGASGTTELLAITDDGYLVIKNGTSFTTRPGASWASGYNAYMTQLDNRMYIVNGQRELVRYSSPTLVGFPTIAQPVITGATNLSNASGTNTKGYRMSAISQVGETLASQTFELKNQPMTIGGTAGGTIRLFFSPSSTASGVLQGYNVYGRETGYERFLGFISSTATIFDDNGTAIPKEFSFPQTSDSTGGPKAKYVKRFQDRLIFAGIDGDPTKMLISGRVPNHEKFDVSFGGNYIKIEPDAGDPITQIEAFQDRIIVFKERSLWQVTLTFEQVGNFFITTPNLKLITASNGCIAPRSVVAVENDIYFLTRKGVFTIGNEANYFDVLRSNEISVRIRPYFENLTISQLQNAVATYHKGKYIIGFPGKNEMMVFDRERAAWTGPWNLDSTVFEVFYDSSNNDHLLFAKAGTVNVDEFSDSLDDDKGTAIETTLRTRSEDFGDWSIFKKVQNIFTEMRNVSGTVTVDIRLENRRGSVETVESFNVTSGFNGLSGWGADLWGNTLWGDTGATPTNVEANYTIRWASLNKKGRTMQLIIKTSASDANYELVGIRGDVKPVSSSYSPKSWRV